jgi:hypothetical protein
MGSTYKTISVDVDVNLEDFDDEDLAQHLRDGGFSVFKADEMPSDLDAGIRAYYQATGGDPTDLIMWARNYLRNATGRVLP